MIYFAGQDKYEIPDNEVNAFLTDFPNAQRGVNMQVGKDRYEIPESEMKDFLADFPSARKVSLGEDAGDIQKMVQLNRGMPTDYKPPQDEISEKISSIQKDTQALKIATPVIDAVKAQQPLSMFQMKSGAPTTGGVEKVKSSIEEWKTTRSETQRELDEIKKDPNALAELDKSISEKDKHAYGTALVRAAGIIPFGDVVMGKLGLRENIPTAVEWERLKETNPLLKPIPGVDINLHDIAELTKTVASFKGIGTLTGLTKPGKVLLNLAKKGRATKYAANVAKSIIDFNIYNIASLHPEDVDNEGGLKESLIARAKQIPKATLDASIYGSFGSIDRGIAAYGGMFSAGYLSALAQGSDSKEAMKSGTLMVALHAFNALGIKDGKNYFKKWSQDKNIDKPLQNETILRAEPLIKKSQSDKQTSSGTKPIETGQVIPERVLKSEPPAETPAIAPEKPVERVTPEIKAEIPIKGKVADFEGKIESIQTKEKSEPVNPKPSGTVGEGVRAGVKPKVEVLPSAMTSGAKDVYFWRNVIPVEYKTATSDKQKGEWNIWAARNETTKKWEVSTGFNGEVKVGEFQNALQAKKYVEDNFSSLVEKYGTGKNATQEKSKPISEQPRAETVTPSSEKARAVVSEKSVKPVGKEPWQMTNKDFRTSKIESLTDIQKEKWKQPERVSGAKSNVQNQWDAEHLQSVKKALSEGKPVPPEVLKDYPDLVKPSVPAKSARKSIPSEVLQDYNNYRETVTQNEIKLTDKTLLPTQREAYEQSRKTALKLMDKLEKQYKLSADELSQRSSDYERLRTIAENESDFPMGMSVKLVGFDKDVDVSEIKEGDISPVHKAKTRIIEYNRVDAEAGEAAYKARDLEDKFRSQVKTDGTELLGIEHSVKKLTKSEQKEFLDILTSDTPKDSPRIKNLSPASKTVLDNYTKFSEYSRNRIISFLRERGRKIPDDWGINEVVYFPHIFYGNIRIFDGKDIVRDANKNGIFNDFFEAMDVAENYKKANPGKKLVIKYNDFSAGDPAQRVTTKQFYRLANKISENAEIDFDTAIKEVMTGTIGIKKNKMKAMANLRKRSGSEGYSKDVFNVLNTYLYRLNKWEYASRYNQLMTPVAEKMRQKGKNVLADDMDSAVRQFWGYQSNTSQALDKAMESLATRLPIIGKVPGARGLFKPFLLERAVNTITRGESVLKLSTPRQAILNSLQPEQTLSCWIGEPDVLRGRKMFFTDEGKKILKENNITGTETIYEGVRKLGKKGIADWLMIGQSGTEHLNIGSTYLAGRVHGEKIGLKGEKLHQYARDMVTMTQYTQTVIESIPFTKTNAGRIFFQFSSFKFKNWGNINRIIRSKDPKVMGRWMAWNIALGGVRAMTLPLSATGIAGISGYAIYKALKDEVGEKAAKQVYFGLPNIIGGEWANSFNPTDLSPTKKDLKQFAFDWTTGPFVADMYRYYSVMRAYKEGYLKDSLGKGLWRATKISVPQLKMADNFIKIFTGEEDKTLYGETTVESIERQFKSNPKKVRQQLQSEFFTVSNGLKNDKGFAKYLAFSPNSKALAYDMIDLAGRLTKERREALRNSFRDFNLGEKDYRNSMIEFNKKYPQLQISNHDFNEYRSQNK